MICQDRFWDMIMIELILIYSSIQWPVVCLRMMDLPWENEDVYAEYWKIVDISLRKSSTNRIDGRGQKLRTPII